MKTVKVTHFSVPFLWIALLVATIFTRFYDIELKPIHFDESINGWFVMQMAKLGYYKYDPNNYHGPLYFYLLQGFEYVWGTSLTILRAVPAVFSVLCVMIFTFGILSSSAVQRWMIFFLFLSPAFLFFGRSGIHEMPFVFFQIVFSLGVLRWFEKPDSKAIALGLVGLWGMTTLKETFAVFLFAWTLALLSLGARGLREFFAKEKWKQAWTSRVTILFALLLVLFVQLFTGFFKNGAGLVDFVKAFLPWMKTGVHGNGHDKEFAYWLKVLWEAEPLVLFGILFAVKGVFAKDKALRVLSVFSLTQFLVYSLIPYKTVWCILSLVWGFYFVLAYSCVELARSRFAKYATWVLIGALAALGVRSAYLSVYKHPLWFEHPYVYVNSTEDLVLVQNTLLQEAQKRPELLQELVQVGMKEQWPWPWVLRSFTHVRYDLCAKTVFQGAAAYFCEMPESLAVDNLLSEPYWKIKVTLRQSREPSVVYLKKSIFTAEAFPEAEVVGVGEFIK
ncbi:TIGR03663 family protein [Bdellovibrio sp. 22V]|uniref:flippase activity-associated protein Agl23 n=1 Tax=Bdellovibrio sp. 22V TaxID=3044166 RepID=UPI002543FAC0|nr:flippase activity-associated protein Agl23 [Bdellovibrio sp. 22V]WII73633.1 TIGR03663 family protein [Bdellovibrio sp. 22V]